MLNFGLMRSGRVGYASSDQLRGLLENARPDDASDAALRAALEASLHLTFVSMFLIALFVAVTAALMPNIEFAAKRAPAE